MFSYQPQIVIYRASNNDTLDAKYLNLIGNKIGMKPISILNLQKM